MPARHDPITLPSTDLDGWTALEQTSAWRTWFRHPALAIGSTLLWGMIEVVALARSRRKLKRS